jgi:hypothetical protein
MRTLRWAIGIVLGLFVVGYLVGGTAGYAQLSRTVRARVRTMLEPPTQVEMQRAATRDSVDNQTMTVAIERARLEMPLGRPASPARVAGAIGGVLVASFGLMFLTGRPNES